MKAYARDDGLYDVESHLMDTKPFDFKRLATPEPLPAGEPIHDLWVRLTVDDDYVVRAIEAASDVTPWGICKEAETALQVMVGASLLRGWSTQVKERLRGAASCTHLKEMLLPLATAALQGIRTLQSGGFVGTGDGPPKLLDTCYAYSGEREPVRMLWPQYYRGPDKPDIQKR